MSVIHVGHVKTEILNRFGGLVDLADVANAQPEQKEMTRLTRSLAAFVLAELGGLDDVGSAQGVTDGTGDNGIDAVYFDAAEKNCFLVQTKWISSGNGSIEVGDILKFIQGVRDLLNNDLSKFNAKMQVHGQKVFAALSDSAARFTLVLAYTGEQPLSEPAERPITDFLSEMNSPTEAVNTQNRIERRDFAALDPNQKRLRTELYLENQKEYVFQTGEQPPQDDSGCTLDEAAVALACKSADIALCVQAKREVGMLYEDITKPPYSIIFNAGTSARALWRAVATLRIVESALKSEQRARTGKEQLIAIHGNRFVLHLVFQKLVLEQSERAEIEVDAVEVTALTLNLLNATIENVLNYYQSAYPANLFKNASRCRDLSRRILVPSTTATT